MLLHEHKDFNGLIATVSDSMRIDPSLVEKDYWIMHSLWGLQQQKFKFELKGGTSLSKGFGLIYRFSEDIDIRIEPPVGLNVKIGKNQNKESHIKSRSEFYDWFASALSIPGVQNIQRDHSFDDQEKMRSGGVRINYLSKAPFLNGLKDGVLLELGFDDTSPNQSVDISSWAYDHAIKFVTGIDDNRAKNVLCYLPEYTFVEKLQAISTKFRQYKQGIGLPRNFLRHYYDIYCLLNCEPVLNFIKSDKYHSRKIKRFSSADNLIIAQNDAFILGDVSDRNLFKSEYQKVVSLYYSGQPSFDDLLKRIHQHIHYL
jgi:hypothetical protein